MWVKKLADGRTIVENAKHGKTWMRTSLLNIVEVFLFHESKRSPSLKGYLEYWHSRGVSVDPHTGRKNLIAERIQGRNEDGTWDTIEYNGISYIRYIAKKAFGKPSER